MARRAAGKSKERKSRPRAFNRGNSTIKRWEKPSDIPLDEEDQFHKNRDRILLEGEDPLSDDEGDEDEVFALKDMPKDSDETEDEDVEQEQGQDEDDDMEQLEHLQAQLTKEKAKKKAKGKKKQDAALSSEGEDAEEEEEGWGRNKAAYYSSNAAQIDSEDEEANEMEEQEAKRLQAKARDVMVDDDFGLGDAVEALIEPAEELGEERVQPAVPEALPKDKHTLLRHLEKTNPEALALARDWDDIAQIVVKTQQKIARLEESTSPDLLLIGMAHLHYQALLQYAITLAFYLYLRSSEEYVARPELLRSHPIMSRLLSFKQHIATLEEIMDDEDDDDEDEFLSDEELEFQLFKKNRKEAADELRMLMEESLVAMQNSSKAASGASQRSEKKVKTDKAGEPPKKKRKTSEKTVKSAMPIFDLEEPEFPDKPKASSRTSSGTDADAFGEQTALDAVDKADKAARKRSLRFHTARIESASARRERARANGGGDDDVPWKERKKEREERQKREVAKNRAQGADLDDEEPEPQKSAGKKRMRDEEGDDSDGAEGYYDLVKRMSKEKKEKKKEEYERALAMAKEGLVVEETADGPRALTRAILKNKGLTPHRSKSVRNPRVKKRLRYDKAKKKVASQRAVYKGGIGATGRYEGEKSGISKVIKSRRL